MKKKFILLPFIGALLFVLSSYKEGPALEASIDATGATTRVATTGCSCHNPVSTATTTVAITLLEGGAPVTSYIAGHTYTVQITGTQTSSSLTLPDFGFQLAIVQMAGFGTSGAVSAGAFSSPPAGTHLQALGSVSIFEHGPVAIAATSGTGGAGTTYSEAITWTAPVAGTGAVIMCGVLNAVNGNGIDDAGDKWDTTKATITELPAITGPATVCVGAVTTLTDAITGGTWASSTVSVATVIPARGIVTGVSGGTSIISYTFGGSTVTQVVTVNPLPVTPAAITGTASVCAGGANTLLTDVTTGGVWSSGNTAAGTVSATGVVTGLTAGTTMISYTETTVCGNAAATVIVTVNPLPVTPVSITGAATVCAGSATTSMSDVTTGGVWSSSNTAIGTVNTAGLVTGINAGTTTISYTETNGCGAIAARVAVTVNALPITPFAVVGTPSVCPGVTMSLSDVTSGGVWSSSNVAVGSVSVSGQVTGVSPGTTTISYTETSAGCGSATAPVVVTVNSLPISPSAIAGTATAVCASGAVISLSDATTGGAWSSSSAAIGTVSASGIVTGISAGTTTISYFFTSASCGLAAAVKVITVNPLPATPAAISGVSTVCAGGATISLSDLLSGGVWSSTNAAVGTISTSGIVTGIGAGTTTISYTESNTCGTQAVTKAVTVNVLPITPAAITGAATVCGGGAVITLTDASTGGAWSSSNTIAGTVNTSGLVTGVGGGTTTISYTNTNGCGSAAATTVVTVNPLPAAGAITGSSAVCTGLTIALTDAVTGGAWFCTNAHASISGVGVVTGVTTGVDTAIYVLVNPCGSDTVKKAVNITATATVATISGPPVICYNTAVSLTDSVLGGTWSSSNTGVVTIGSSGGLATGMSTGTATIVYTGTSTCGSALASKVVTVSPLPGVITGNAYVCAGAMNCLTDASTGGTWSSGNTNAVIGATGCYHGNTAGTSTISYTLGTGCFITAIVTVNPLPSAILGLDSVCATANVTLSDAVTGGLWSSNNTPIATAGSASGIVSGVMVGTAIINYTAPDGCMVSVTVTVNGLPENISGNPNLCPGTTTILSSAPSTGAWSSGNTSVATAGAETGIITGVAVGSAVITYMLPTGCKATFIETVNPLPPSILGTPAVCYGSTATLSDAVTGGIWSSNNTTVATIGSSSGIVSGLSLSATMITYTAPDGCVATTGLTVNPPPSAISGMAQICPATTTILSSSPLTGTWSSSNISVATAGLVTGIITGITAGTSVITYTLPTGCISMLVETVNPLPPAISGVGAGVCLSTTVTLSDAMTGGTWSSNNTAVAGVGSSSGVVSGFSLGAATVTYVAPDGCITTASLAVNPPPSPVSGTTHICPTATTILSSSPLTGAWSSSNAAVATAGAGTGIITGVSAGTAAITYTLPTGCIATFIETVNPEPAAIAGIGAGVCLGFSETLSEATTGGTWSSSSTSIAPVTPATGVVIGFSLGVVMITYTGADGCITTAPVFVNPIPTSISGTTQICPGTTTILSNVSTSGSWSSSNTAIATAGSLTGIVTGVSTGLVAITFALPTGCITTIIETVDPLPAAISGYPGVCLGLTATLADATTGGVWSSSNTTDATIGSASGIVSGLVPGTTTISYTLPTGCFATLPLPINPQPSAITGPMHVCANATSILSNIATSGSWASSNVSVAIVGSGSGVISGISAGTAVITFTLPTGCITTTVETVNPLPAAISGPSGVCFGTTVMLSDSIAGGAWSSSNTSVAPVGSSSGVVYGFLVDEATITYTLPSTGCSVTRLEVVNSPPPPITGATHVCPEAMAQLFNISTSGSWSSGDSLVAIAGSGTGIVTGISPGITTITFTLPTGCTTTFLEDVDPLPAPISGATGDCIGFYAALSDATTGGTWSSNDTAVTQIDSATGILYGNETGFATITYTIPTGCLVTATEIVNSLPEAITGSTHICVGAQTILGSAPETGTWGSNDPAVATAGEFTGIVNGVAAGTAVITYTLPTGCTATMIETVIPDAACQAYVQNTVDNGQDGDIKVYPNPASGTFTIELPGQYTNAVVTIMDVLGRVVETTKMGSSKMRVTGLDMNNMASGTYIVKVSAGQRTFRKNVTLVK